MKGSVKANILAFKQSNTCGLLSCSCFFLYCLGLWPLVMLSQRYTKLFWHQRKLYIHSTLHWHPSQPSRWLILQAPEEEKNESQLCLHIVVYSGAHQKHWAVNAFPDICPGAVLSIGVEGSVQTAGVEAMPCELRLAAWAFRSSLNYLFLPKSSLVYMFLKHGHFQTSCIKVRRKRE